MPKDSSIKNRPILTLNFASKEKIAEKLEQKIKPLVAPKASLAAEPKSTPVAREKPLDQAKPKTAKNSKKADATKPVPEAGKQDNKSEQEAAQQPTEAKPKPQKPRKPKTKKQLFATKNNKLLNYLRTNYPDCFTTPPSPLAIGIHKQLQEAEDAKEGSIMTRTNIYKTLQAYTRRKDYGQSIVLNAPRLNLDGSSDTTVTQQHVENQQELDKVRLEKERLQQEKKEALKLQKAEKQQKQQEKKELTDEKPQKVPQEQPEKTLASEPHELKSTHPKEDKNIQ
jgi:ProP effector